MRRDKTNAELRTITSGVTLWMALSITGIGWYTEVPITPQWAMEQMEHSWLGTLESSECTWTAWAKPATPTSSTPRRAMALTHRLRTLSEPIIGWLPCSVGRQEPVYTSGCTCDAEYFGIVARDHNPKSSRNRFVCARLTGISVCFLSSMRS